MPKKPTKQNQSAIDTENPPEKPRAFLLGVVTATLMDEIHAEIQRIESGKAASQPPCQRQSDNQVRKVVTHGAAPFAMPSKLTPIASGLAARELQSLDLKCVAGGLPATASPLAV